MRRHSVVDVPVVRQHRHLVQQVVQNQWRHVRPQGHVQRQKRQQLRRQQGPQTQWFVDVLVQRQPQQRPSQWRHVQVQLRKLLVQGPRLQLLQKMWWSVKSARQSTRAVWMRSVCWIMKPVEDVFAVIRMQNLMQSWQKLKS